MYIVYMYIWLLMVAFYINFEANLSKRWNGFNSLATIMYNFSIAVANNKKIQKRKYNELLIF